MLYQVETDKSLDKIDADLRAAAQDNKFGIIAVHDIKETMRNKGVDFEGACMIYEVCNPQQAKKALEADGAFSTVLPCRISVYESGGKRRIATVLPTALVQLFQNEELAPVANEVEQTLKRIMTQAA